MLNGGQTIDSHLSRHWLRTALFFGHVDSLALLAILKEVSSGIISSSIRKWDDKSNAKVFFCIKYLV